MPEWRILWNVELIRHHQSHARMGRTGKNPYPQGVEGTNPMPAWGEHIKELIYRRESAILFQLIARSLGRLRPFRFRGCWDSGVELAPFPLS